MSGCCKVLILDMSVVLVAGYLTAAPGNDYIFVSDSETNQAHILLPQGDTACNADDLKSCELPQSLSRSHARQAQVGVLLKDTMHGPEYDTRAVCTSSTPTQYLVIRLSQIALHNAANTVLTVVATIIVDAGLQNSCKL